MQPAYGRCQWRFPLTRTIPTPSCSLTHALPSHFARSSKELVDTERAYVKELMMLLEEYQDKLPDEVCLRASSYNPDALRLDTICVAGS